jgi:hypothetical protein
MLNFEEWKLLSLVHCESSLFLISDALSFKCQDSLYKNDFNTFSSSFFKLLILVYPQQRVISVTFTIKHNFQDVFVYTH